MGMVTKIRKKPSRSSQEKVVLRNSTEIITEPMGSTEESTLPIRLPTMLHPDWNRLKESTPYPG